MDEGDLMPVAEFAKRKGLSEEKVIRMIRDGFYSGRKVGDAWFVNASELSNTQAVTAGGASSEGSAGTQAVRVVDFDMPFFSLMGFFIKAILAAVPALLIASLIVSVVTGFVLGLMSR